MKFDISDPSSIELARNEVSDDLGHVDILVTNAGMFGAPAWIDTGLAIPTERRVAVTDEHPFMRGRGWGRNALHMSIGLPEFEVEIVPWPAKR